jgi:EAL and modified HD-GYP domain-containing signal transduction protein
MSMDDILKTVVVPQEVRDALLKREGEFGEMLRVVELLENPTEGAALAKSLKRLRLTVPEIREIELRAFEWVNELAQEVHAA